METKHCEARCHAEAGTSGHFWGTPPSLMPQLEFWLRPLFPPSPMVRGGIVHRITPRKDAWIQEFVQKETFRCQRKAHGAAAGNSFKTHGSAVGVHVKY